MNINSHFDHFNFNVLDLNRSIAFYRQALGLKESRRKTAADGSFTPAHLLARPSNALRPWGW